MKKILKILKKIELLIFIVPISYINVNMYMKLYNKYLKSIGVNIDGNARYISERAYIDGIDYSLISIGNDVVISRDVIILTHDYSICRGIESLGYRLDEEFPILETVSIGKNSFIGAGSIILPGTKIGENVIIGAGTVVKGNIEDNSIVIGGKSSVIGDTKEWAKAYIKEHIEIKQKMI